MDSGFGRSLPRHRVVAVERNALRNQRNIEFHATIGKKIIVVHMMQTGVANNCQQNHVRVITSQQQRLNL